MEEKKVSKAEEVQEDTPVVKDVESARFESRELPNFLSKFATILMLVMAIYHIYAARFGGFPGIQHTAIHVGLGLAMIFLVYPFNDKTKKSKVNLCIDLGIMVFAIASMIYVCLQYSTLNDRVGLPASTTEMIFGIITFVILIEAARRMMGWPFTIICLAFIAFMFLGPWLPYPLTHAGATVNRFVQLFYLQMSGIYGSITRTSANVVVVFVIFASIVKYSPIGDFIMDVAMAAVGGVRGGPAKVAVVSSGMMGMLSGNSVANVAGTGSITIPLMKKTGYRAEFAGGVESVASAGGQIMPPVMGTSVFVMMELVGTSYQSIIGIALPIALFYYLGLLISVDTVAVRDSLYGIPKANRPVLWATIKRGWYLVTPVVVLAVLMAMGMTPQRAGFWGIVSAIIVCFICPYNRMSLKTLLIALCDGIKDCGVMFTVAALASLIQGIVQVSGLGVRLSSILVSMCGGNLLLMLVVTAICCIILGMGLPVVVCYSFLAILVCPAMVELGVPILAAHMFVFYFGCMSCITPPVATAALVASGIAKAPFMKTALNACALAFSIFFFPFYMVYSPEFLMADGFTIQTLLCWITVLFSVYGAAVGFAGAAWPSIEFQKNFVFRGLFVLFAVVVLVPIPGTNYIGAAAIIVLQVLLMLMAKKDKGAHIKKAPHVA